MDPAAPATFVVYGNLTGRLSGLYAGGGSQTLVFTPDLASDFKSGEAVEVILTGSLTSADGASLDPPIVYRFRAEALGGTGVFNPGIPIAGQLGARGLAAGDWDGDGDLDLAVANFSANSVVVLENDPIGDFTDVQTIFPLLGATGLTSGDWDGDGDLDLAVANFSANTVVVLENDSTGSFTADPPVAGQIGASALAAGDWDGDGDLDLAVANSGGDNVNTLENQP
jgi:hypothetical protein